jgi:DNA-directed RNA polymerase sigma subunit (sigma70/sigma32)
VHNQIQAVDGLSGVAEAVLFEQAQAGCRASLNQLMSRHEGLVPFVVRRQALGKLPFAEAAQAGRIGLWRAILGYDPQNQPHLLRLSLGFAAFLLRSPGLSDGLSRQTSSLVT